MLATVNSVNDVPIRLTEERWAHILEGHGELANMQGQILDTVAKPDRILAGGTGELLAIKEIESGKWLIVVYRENSDDGFIITAFWTRRERSLKRRKQLWP
jgi:hypothetical protein